MPGYSGETQTYVRRQKAAEEQMRFEKAGTLSRIASPSGYGSLRMQQNSPGLTATQINE
jgi:hypothetical protein